MPEDYKELTYLSGIIEEAEYITKKSGCDEEQVYDYLYYREVFFHLYALSRGCTVDELVSEFSEEDDEEDAIFEEEARRFVSERTGMDVELIDRLSDIGLEYAKRDYRLAVLKLVIVLLIGFLSICFWFMKLCGLKGLIEFNLYFSTLFKVFWR